MQLVSHHWSLTADETAWHSCTTGAEKPLAEPTRKANARAALIVPKQREVARARSHSTAAAAINGMPAVPRARDVLKMTICLVGLCVCGLLYRVQGPVQGNQILFLAAFYAVAWWALWFAAPPPARLPIRIVLWSLFASFYLVENSWVLVPVVAVLLDLACRLLLRTLPRLAAAEAAARASKQSASDASRKKAAASPTKKKAD